MSRSWDRSRDSAGVSARVSITVSVSGSVSITVEMHNVQNYNVRSNTVQNYNSSTGMGTNRRVYGHGYK